MLLTAREAFLFQNDPAGADRMLMRIRMLIENPPRSRRGYEAPWRTPQELVALGEALLMLGVEPRIILENSFRRAERSELPPREAFLAIGRLALEKHDFAIAAEAFRAGIQRFPEDPDMHWGLAQAFQSSDREEMLNSIQAALNINPRHVPSLLLLADHLIDAEQYKEAEDQLEAALQVNPHEPKALAYRALLAHLRNDFAREEQFRTAALRFWKTNPEVDHLIGLKLSRKYRFEEGAAAQRRALSLQRDYLPARRQLAEDLLRLGHTDEGWKLAEAVHTADEYDVTAYNLTLLHDTMRKFQTLTNDGFIVRMSPHEAQLYGDRVLRLLTRARDVLADKYGLTLTRPTVVEIFPNQKDFAVRTFGMPGNPGYLGVCFGSVITANSPASQVPNPANWEDVLWHEFCHVITLTATRNRMPRWLSEGISVYEERQANPAWGERMNLAYREMTLGEDLTPVSRLSSAFLTPRTPRHLQFAYFQSSLVVEFLIDKFGIDAMKRILKDLHDGKEINEAIAAHTMPMPELEKQFASYARQLAENLAPGVDFEKPPVTRSETERQVWEKLHPNNYYVRFRKAEELIDAEKWEEAKPVLESLAKDYAGESGVENPLWLLALVHRNLNDTNAELATLRQFAERESGFVDLYVRLIELCMARQDWAAVTNYADRLLALHPLISLPYRALARAGAELESWDTAILGYRKLLLLDPADPADVHYQLARLLHMRGERDEARRHVLQALEEAPRFRDAQKLLLQLASAAPTTGKTDSPPVQELRTPQSAQ